MLRFLKTRLALFLVALLLIGGLGMGFLSHPGTAAAYQGQPVSTWYFGLTHPNSGCGYDIFVATGYSVLMYCTYKDGYGNQWSGSNYISYTCWQGGGCYFSGTVNSQGWSWVAVSVTMVMNDNYNGWHGYIRNAWCN